MKNSRNLADLLPVVAAKASAFVAACRAAGIEVLIYSTLRDNEEQAMLYAMGRTTMGPNASARKPMGETVTDAEPGKSYHNWGCAFDFVPVVHGKAMWKDEALYKRCGEIASLIGLEWSGRWTGKRRERAHCQYTGGLSLADLAAGKVVH